MDKTFEKPDENVNLSFGKKRPQTQSPFSAATPKSRIGKEPKRPFGESPLASITNKADSNLEETAIETPTPPTDVSSTSIADESSCVDPNLEQTVVMDRAESSASLLTSTVVNNMSNIEEDPETDADVTLADSFAEQMSVEDRKTPTPSSPQPTVDEIATPTAPPTLAAHIQKEELLSSPVFTPKTFVDQSMHEFLMLEQESHHVVNERELREKIQKLQAEIQMIHEARIFEEKALMQQIDSIGKKARDDKSAAQAKIRELEAKLEEAGTTGTDDGEKKKELEDQLALLTARIEELTEKALKVEEMKEGMLAYEERLQVVMNEKLAANAALSQTREENEQLQKINKEGSDKIAELEAKLVGNSETIVATSSDSEARIVELEQDREELRQMMINEMSSLESQLDEVREQLKKEQEKNSAPKEEEDHLVKIQQLEEQAAIANSRIAEMEQSAAQFSSEIEAFRQQHLVEIEEMQKKHADQMQLLQEQFSLAESKLGEKAESLDELTAQLAAAHRTIEVFESEDNSKEIEAIRQQHLAEMVEMEKKNADHTQLLQEQFTMAESKLAEFSQKAESLDELAAELATARQELEEIKSGNISETAKLQEQLLVAESNIAELSQNAGKVDELISQLKSELLEVQYTSEEELNTLRQKLSCAESALTVSVEEAGKVEELTAQLAAAQQKVNDLESQNSSEEIQQKHADEMKALQEKYESELKTAQHICAEVEESRVQISELTADLANCQQELHTLRAQLDASCNEHTEKMEEVVANVAKMSQMEESIVAYETRLETVMSEKLEMQTALGESKIQIEELEKLHKEHLERVDQLTSQLSSGLEAMLEKHQTELVEVQKKHADELQEIQNQLSVAESKLSEFAENSGNMEELTAQLATAQREILEFKSLVDELQSSRNAEIEMLREQFATAQTALSSASQDSDRLEQLNAQLESAHSQIAYMHDSVQNSKDIQQVQEKEVEELKEQLSVAESKNAELAESSRKIEELNSQLATAEQDLLEAHKSLGDVQKSREEESSALREQLSVAESALSVAMENAGMVEELNAKLAAAQQQINDLESWNASEDLQQKHAEEIKALEEKYNSQLTATEQLRAEMERSSMEHNQEKAGLVEKAEQVEELRKQIDDYQTRLETAVREKTEVESQLNRAVEESNEVTASISQMKSLVSELEAAIELKNKQLDERVAELASWKAQAQGIDVLTNTLSTMQNQLKEMSEKLEASDRRVIEVEETAKHDVTLMQEEVDGRQAELEEVRARVVELEVSLERAAREVARLEKVCDEFDDDEAKLKERISELEAEVKQLKGVKTPPRVMGLIEQARQGIKPISRDNSRVEDKEVKEEDAFEDASDSFVNRQTMQQTMQTALDATNVSTAHPDDSMDTTTPQKKKMNRSNCQQQ